MRTFVRRGKKTPPRILSVILIDDPYPHQPNLRHAAFVGAVDAFEKKAKNPYSHRAFKDAWNKGRKAFREGKVKVASRPLRFAPK